MATIDPATAADVDSLVQEREFLLRSLADLDAEYEAGDLEDDDYRALTDDYTARAAAVLRALELTKSPQKRGEAAARSARVGLGAPEGRATTVPRPRRPAAAPAETATRNQGAEGRAPALASRRRWRSVAVVAVVLGFGALAAWAVAQSSGSRLPGQTPSGNRQIAGTPLGGGVDTRLVDASNLVNQGKVADALRVYDAILHDDPNQPVALADGGWLEAQAGLAGNRAELVDIGLTKIEKSEKLAPSFADAHFFRGFLLLRAKNDAPGAVTELRLYLGAVDPAAPQVARVQSLLQEAITAAGTNLPPGPNAPTTTR